MKQLHILLVASLSSFVGVGCGDDDTGVADTGVADTGVADTGGADTGGVDGGSDAAGSDVGGGDAGETDIVRVLCTASHDHQIACGETPSQTIDECVADPDDACYPTHLRTDLRTAIAECVENRECGSSDDDCFTATTLGATPTSVASSFQDYCLTRVETCTEVNNDYCFLEVFTDETIEGVRACLEGSCASARDCIDAVLDCSGE